MTKYTIILLFLVLLLNQACKDDIEPSTDGKITAVVYGILDKYDTIHYVKINRAFYGGGDALSIAKISDSSYFKTVEATIKEYDGSELERTWVLNDTLIETKEDGVFFAPEQIVYYFKTSKNAPLLDGREYRLEIVADKGLSSECIITGETKLVEGFSIDSPLKDKGSFKFADANQFTGQTVRIKPGSSEIIECKLFVEIEEYDGASIKNTIGFEWNLGTIIVDEAVNEKFEFNADGKTFYDLIKKNCSDDNTITKRLLKSITINAYGGDDALNKYIILSKPSSSLTQNKPLYTNLKVTNENRVVGIFASRNLQKQLHYKWIHQAGTTSYIRCIDKQSTIELCQGSITGFLLFCSDLTEYDQGESFYCD